jgi:hypothetical protein
MDQREKELKQREEIIKEKEHAARRHAGLELKRGRKEEETRQSIIGGSVCVCVFYVCMCALCLYVGIKAGLKLKRGRKEEEMIKSIIGRSVCMCVPYLCVP